MQGGSFTCGRCPATSPSCTFPTKDGGHSTQRAACKEVQTPGHEARDPGAKCSHEAPWHGSHQCRAGYFLVPAMWDTFSGTLSLWQAEALEELLPNSAPMVVADESEPLDN